MHKKRLKNPCHPKNSKCGTFSDSTWKSAKSILGLWKRIWREKKGNLHRLPFGGNLKNELAAVEKQEKYLQEKNRTPNELITLSKMEYVWWVSLTRGDWILSSEEEAGGYWGPGVFLTTTPRDHDYSLTAQVVYWAGGIDLQDRGDPLVIKTAWFPDLAASVQKAVCIQSMYERDRLRRSPMLAPIDSARLTHLIQSLPNSLKTCSKLSGWNAAGSCPKCCSSWASGGLGQMMHLATWSEFVQEIVNYGCWTGWVR